MEIDQYGEVLVGCIDCNRWGHPGDDKLIMELMESDLEALRGIVPGIGFGRRALFTPPITATLLELQTRTGT
jgi:hypothetical protein